jgi:hypothetical protein
MLFFNLTQRLINSAVFAFQLRGREGLFGHDGSPL